MSNVPSDFFDFPSSQPQPFSSQPSLSNCVPLDNPPSDYFDHNEQDSATNNNNDNDNDLEPGSFFSDPDIKDAIQETAAERVAELSRQGVVIQHRRKFSPKRVVRSSSALPETPTKKTYGVRRNFGFSFDDEDDGLSPSKPPPSSPPVARDSEKMTNSDAPALEEMNFPTLKSAFSGLKKNTSALSSRSAEEEELLSQMTSAAPTTTAATTQESRLDAAFDDPFSFEDEEEVMRESDMATRNSEVNATGDKGDGGSITGQENFKPAEKPPQQEEDSNPFLMEDDEGPSQQLLNEQFSATKPTEDSIPFQMDDDAPASTLAPHTAPAAAPSPFTSAADAAAAATENLTINEPPVPANLTQRIKLIDSSGKTFHALQYLPAASGIYKSKLATEVFERTSRPRPVGSAQREFYGVDIFGLRKAIEQEDKEKEEIEKQKETLAPKVTSLAMTAILNATKVDPKTGRTQLWTEKYRAKRFTDLLGDERTHRHVLKWLKKWDPIVFPGAKKPIPKKTNPIFGQQNDEEQAHRKILLISGPPGLGKTTMAHVLARQAGYEPLEINASDDRTGNVVRNRIKDTVGMETVRMGDTKRGKPVCVIVDEVDGVTGEGEGGFIRALVDLIQQDAKNADRIGSEGSNKRGKRKGDNFRFFRPIIAVCNDLYANSLRTLRPLAEVVNTRRPPLGLVTQRLKHILEREGVDGDNDAIRRILEIEGGVGSGGGGGASKNAASEWGGDVRGIMVAGEWICGRLRSAACSVTAASLEVSNNGRIKLTKKWLEGEYSAGGGLGTSDGSGGRGRGSGIRSVVDQLFIDHESKVGSMARPMAKAAAGTVGTSRKADGSLHLGGDAAKRQHIDRLRTLVEATGEFDKVMTDCFAKYPTIPFHDDPLLTKPNQGYEWLAFYDAVSGRVFGSSQDYELMPYLATPALAFHKLFACSESAQLKGRRLFKGSKFDKSNPDDDENQTPFSGPKAEFESREGRKANMSLLTHLTTILPHSIIRSFKPVETMAYELAPWLVQIIQPKVTPVVVGGSQGFGIASVRRDVEKKMVERAAGVMSQCCVGFEKVRIEADPNVGFQRNGGFVLRMEPPIDTLTLFQTLSLESPPAATRYAVRQVLDQEYQKQMLQRQSEARQARMKGGEPVPAEAEKKDKNKAEEDKKKIKRDFFGRIIESSPPKKRKGGAEADEDDGDGRAKKRKGEMEGKVWCTFKEGFSNAVRKPITWNELMAGF